jgi:hypothetical protein
MTTRELLAALERLAKAAKQLAEDTADVNNDGKVNWDDVVAASKDAAFIGLVDSVLGQTKRQEIYAGLLEIDRKKRELAGGRSYAEMSTDELDKYAALRTTENVIYQAADKIERGRARFVGWLVDDALPALGTVLKTVIPLF